MDRQAELVVLGTQPDEEWPEERAARQIERTRGVVQDGAPRDGRSLPGRHGLEVDDLERDDVRARDPHDGRPILARESGTQ